MKGDMAILESREVSRAGWDSSAGPGDLELVEGVAFTAGSFSVTTFDFPAKLVGFIPVGVS